MSHPVEILARILYREYTAQQCPPAVERPWDDIPEGDPTKKFSRRYARAVLGEIAKELRKIK